MELPVAMIALRLFVRLLLGAIFLSTGVSKFAHPRRFQRGIQDYEVLPAKLESKLALSRLLTFGIPIVELAVALSLLSGFLLVPASILGLVLLVVFSAAIASNLLRGRTDLSCHCGGSLGEHRISWGLVGRNGLLMVSLLVLLLTPSDIFTLEMFIRSPSTLSAVLFSTALPVALLVGTVVAVLALIRLTRGVWHPSSIDSTRGSERTS